MYILSLFPSQALRFELYVNIQLGKHCSLLLQRFDWNPVH